MLKNKGISANQFFSVMFLSRLSSSILFTPLMGFDITASERIFAEPLAWIIGAVFSLPAYFAVRKNKNSLASHGKTGRKLALGICGIYFLAGLVLYGAVFAFFSRMKLLEGFSAHLLFLLTFAAGFYGALKGSQSLGRTGVIIFTLVTAGVAVMASVSLGGFSFVNIMPLTDGGGRGIFLYILFSAFSSAELIAGVFLAREAEEFKTRGTVFKILAAAAVPALISFTVAGVFGDLANLLPFPIFRISSVGKYVLFSRLDSVFAFIWISSFAVKVALLIFGIKKIMYEISQDGKHTVVLSAVSLVSVLFSLALSMKFVKLPFEAIGAAMTALFFLSLLSVKYLEAGERRAL